MRQQKQRMHPLGVHTHGKESLCTKPGSKISPQDFGEPSEPEAQNDDKKTDNPGQYQTPSGLLARIAAHVKGEDILGIRVDALQNTVRRAFLIRCINQSPLGATICKILPSINKNYLYSTFK